MHVLDKGAGTPVVLLHGFGVDHRILLPLDPAIAASGDWRRIYIDLPGHGGSPAGDVASTMDVIAAVEEEIRARVEGQAFAIIGNSFGGMISRYIAHDLRDDVIGLATIATAFVADSGGRRVPERAVIVEDGAVLAGLGEAAEAYTDMAVVHTPAGAAAFIDHVYPGIVAADHAAMDRIAENYLFAEEPEDAWPAPFTQPSLFIAGRQDHVVGFLDAWSHIDHYPRATFAVLDSTGHNIQVEQPAITAALVTEWLGRVARSQGADSN